MGFIERFLYKMNVGKVRTIDQATRLVAEGRSAEAVALLGGLELKVNIRFRYLYYLVLGSAHLQLRQLHAAVNCFEETISVNPNTGSAYFQLAVARARMGRIAEALDGLKAALARELPFTTPLPDSAKAFVAELEQFSTEVAQRVFDESLQQVVALLGDDASDREVSLSTLEQLDSVFQKRPDEYDPDRITFFLGEAIRREFGGEWCWALPVEESYLVGVGAGREILPQKVLTEKVKSLVECYRELQEMTE